MWTTIKRVSGAGWKNFTRGGAVSAATVLIMTVTLSILGSLLFLSALLNFTLDVIRDKVDVSVYFVTTATEAEIFALRDKLTALPEVEGVGYTSREQALADFRARHENDQLTLQALEELGENPLAASLQVRAKDPSDYERVVSFLEATPALSPNGTSIVDRVNYEQNKETIDRLSLLITATRSVGFAVVLLFAIASMLIAFATIRLAIYTAKDEIAVMQLVGASGSYVRGPFIVAGIITGIIAALIVTALLYPSLWYVAAKTTTWFGGFDLFGYYRQNFALIFLTLLGSGMVLGALASLLAIRRYLKV